MKTLLVALSVLVSTSAHADLRLSAGEVASKKLSICRSLQSSIENVSQLANHHSIAGDSADNSFFTRMQSDLTEQFKQIQCDSRLEQAARDHADLLASCQKSHNEHVANYDKTLDISVAALSGKGNDKKIAQLEARNEELRKQYAKLGCERVAKKIKKAD